MRSTIRVALLMTAIFLIVASSRAEVYQNEEFGIELPIPVGVFLCPKPEQEHDHGAVMLLDKHDPKHCIGRGQTRSIEVSAFFNAADETKYLRDNLNWWCDHFGEEPCGPAPDGLEITGLPSAAARIDNHDGWTDILLVTQAGTPIPAYDASVPSVNYSLSLHTTVQHLEEDLCVFRIILKTIQLHPDCEKWGQCLK